MGELFILFRLIVVAFPTGPRWGVHETRHVLKVVTLQLHLKSVFEIIKFGVEVFAQSFEFKVKVFT